MGKGLDTLLDQAEEIFGKLPPNDRLEARRLKKTMPVSGQRLMKKAGSGTDVFELREFVPFKDEERKVSAAHLMRTGKKIVVDREQESPHHFWVWADISASMEEFDGQMGPRTKKHTALLIALAFAMDLGVQEEAVGLVHQGRLYRGGRKVAARIEGGLTDLTLMGEAELPELHRSLKANDKVILIGDFLTKDKETLSEYLDELGHRRMQAGLIMVLDPAELEFPFTGNREFIGTEGEKSLSGASSQVFNEAQGLRIKYLKAIRAHIEMVKTLCEERGFRFVLHSTARPPEEAIIHFKNGQDNPLALVPEVGL